jgi:DNA (cytosine-5)-methyltransferase 1
VTSGLPLEREGKAVIDLCCGAGGFTEAARLVGLNVLLAVDVDSSRTNTYALNHDSRVVVADINREVVASGPAWGIIGGPPCQPFSRVPGCPAEGAVDARNAIPGFINHIRALRPEWFVLENVASLKSHHWGYFLGILAELRGLGYYVDHAVLNAAHFGVPQRRRRLFVAGRRDGWYWVWPQGAGREAAWGEALLPLLEAREPDRDWLPDWVISRAQVPDYAMINPQLSGPGPNWKVQWRTADKPAYTITVSGTGRNYLVKLPGDGVYVLNERECALLQGFRPDYRFSSGAEIGDAVPPPLGAAVIRAVALLDDLGAGGTVASAKES